MDGKRPVRQWPTDQRREDSLPAIHPNRVAPGKKQATPLYMDLATLLDRRAESADHPRLSRRLYFGFLRNVFNSDKDNQDYIEDWIFEWMKERQTQRREDKTIRATR